LTVTSLLLYLHPDPCYASHTHPPLHSFPTRRSSDLPPTSRTHSTSTASSSRSASSRTPNGSRAPSSCRLTRRSSSTSVGRPRCRDRKSTRLNSSHVSISYAVFCLKKKKNRQHKPKSS